MADQAEEAFEASLVADEVSIDSGSSSGSIDDVEMSLKGIILLINNQWAEAEELFKQYRDYSPLMSFGSSFVMVMEGLMSFEDEKLQAALEALKNTEKRCELTTGFKKGHMKKKRKQISLEDRLMRQIVTGDCLLYESILIFINQDIASYIKGGWCLRKAWKLYERTMKEILIIHDRVSKFESCQPKNGEAPHLVDIPLGIPASKSFPAMHRSRSDSFETASLDGGDMKEVTDLSSAIITRLLGSVSFGHGLLQLVISLVPPKILKIIEFLGFEGDRQIGLKELERASLTKDMKAPLAMFGLLWYHTIMRPFFALDGTNVSAGIADAEVVIERCKKEYPDSALYLFFKGRLLRLEAEVDEALVIYKQAMDKCANQREIQLISIYEIGWLHMLRLEYKEASKCFHTLRKDSRWSKCYYAYLTGICLGAAGDVSDAHKILKEVPGLMKRKNNQLERFVSKRAEKFKKNVPTQEHLMLLILEVLYLWSSIPHCKKSDLERHLEECNLQTDKKLFHLRSLIEGAIYNSLGSTDMAAQCFEETIARQNGLKEDKHVAAFACYELASIHLQKPGGQNSAKKYFIKAKDHYNDYDFENRLHVRILAALKRIKDGTSV